MNIEDINSLQERINRIALAGASPDIIIAPKPEVQLRQYATRFQANRCTLLMLYNEFRGRNVSYPVRQPVPVTSSSVIVQPQDIPVIYRNGILHIGHVIAAVANSREELSTLINVVRNLIALSVDQVPELDTEFTTEMEQQTRALFEVISLIPTPTIRDTTNTVTTGGDNTTPVRHDIIVAGVLSQPVHLYVADAAPSANAIDLRRVYSALKGTVNMSGRILPIQAIVGGIAQAYSHIPLTSLYSIISRLEYETSPLHMNQAKINDALEWYREQMDMKISQQAASFYEESLTRLLNIPTIYTNRENRQIPLQMYAPQVELERLIIRPTDPLDMVDVMSRARTSPDVPIIVANIDDRKIIKVYNKPETMRKIELNWFMEAKRETQRNQEGGFSTGKNYGMMNIVLRISRFPDRYQMIQYNSNKNYFSVNRTEKYLSTSEIITLLCNHLGVNNLTAPQVSSTTYSFVSNYIESTTAPRNTGDFGLDRHVLAWLITNPPPIYRNANLHRFVFVKEDTKPNALRDHISIHIQLGTEKLYLTLSRHETTSGTLVPVPLERQGEFANLEERIQSVGIDNMNKDLIGFYQKQKYLQVRINKAQSIHHARIAQTVYAHIMSMYLRFYHETRGIIFTMTGISLPHIGPRLVPLNERIPDLREKYAFFDPVLYRYVSDIPPTSLPVPIDRDEAEYWRRQMHEVIRLPALVVNNPLITFKTSGEIWVRTPQQGRFILVEKKEGGYIPVMYNSRAANGILVSVNSDMTLTDTQNRSKGETYILKEYKSLSDKPGRLAYISKAALELLTPVFAQNTQLSNVYRLGISMNILHALNNALNLNVTPAQVAQHAYLCMQENWEQSVTDVAEDIRSQRIIPIRHFRALEHAYRVNIYFLLDDQLEPYLRKPPHAYFYLHREARREWPTLIFHSLTAEPDVVSLITVSTGRGTRGYQHLFQGQEYLDDLMNRNNIIRMVSPADGVNERLLTVPIRMDIGNWRAVEQVVDAYGKCRAITYARRVPTVVTTGRGVPRQVMPETVTITSDTQVATINIGFAPIQNLPMGEIRMPTMITSSGQRVPAIIQDLLTTNMQPVRRLGETNNEDTEFAQTLTNLILRPVAASSLSVWAENERNARILRIVTHLLYSQMDLSTDDFFRLVRVRRDIEYDTTQLRHSLPNIQGSYENAWIHLASVLPGMVEALPIDEDTYAVDDEDDGEDDRPSLARLMMRFSIFVPDEQTRRALYLHTLSTPKIRWPMRFPSYVQYSWDIQAGREEMVFLREIDLVQYLIMSRAPTETPTIVVSPIPYILSRGDNKYLIQMASNTMHAKYIAYIWDTNEEGPLNPGYEGIISDIDFPWREVPHDFTDRLYEVSFTAKDGRVFVIIPI